MSPNSARVPVTKQTLRCIEHVPLKQRVGGDRALRFASDDAQNFRSRHSGPGTLDLQVVQVDLAAGYDVARGDKTLAAHLSHLALALEHLFAVLATHRLSQA